MTSFTNPTMEAQYNQSFYSREELEQIGFQRLGENVLISRLARFYAPHKISIGNNVRIDDFAILSGAIKLGDFIHISAQASITGGDGIASSVSMGDFCSLSLGSRILSMSDDLSSGVLSNSCIPEEYRSIKSSHIIMPRHNHIGAMSLVLPHTLFEEGANLGPQSLIGDKTLKAFGYYFGAPARLLKMLDSDRLKKLESKFLESLSLPVGGGARLNFSLVRASFAYLFARVSFAYLFARVFAKRVFAKRDLKKISNAFLSDAPFTLSKVA